MLLREWSTTGTIRFRTFYLRRFKRLTPALAVMVGATTVIAAVVMTPFGPQETVAMTAIGAMALAANVVIAWTTGGYFDAPAESNPLLNTWSLSVEEQFYLVFPILLVAGWRLARRGGARHAAIALVAVTALVSFALAVLGARGLVVPGAGWLLGFYSPVTRAWEFAAGALLALVMSRRSALRRRPSTAIGLMGVVLLVLSVVLITEQTPFPGLWTLLPVTGTMLVLLAGFDQGNAVSRTLAAEPGVKVGDWSYSIYLWHWPAIVFAGLLWPDDSLVLVVAAVLSLVPALASYRWIEQPMRRRPSVGFRATAVMVSAWVVPPVVLAAVLGLTASRDMWVAQLWVPELRTFSSWATSHEGWDDCLSRGTLTGDPSAVNTFGDCVWNAGGSGVPLYLVGDSNANQFTEPLIAVSTATGGPLTLDAAASCPLVDITVGSKGAYTPASALCGARVDETMSRLTTSPPGVVVLANADNYLFDEAYSIGDGVEPPASGRAEKAAEYEDALRRTVTELQSAGHSVILVQPVHRFDVPEYPWNVVACTVLDFARGGCTTTAPEQFFEALQSDSRQLLVRVAEETGSGVVDLRPFLCTEGECSTRRGRMALYGDPAHVSVEASIALTPVFQEAVETALSDR